MPDPSTPLEAYRAIIDQLVADRLRSALIESVPRGSFSNAPDHRGFNDFLATLDQPRRDLVAGMLREVRDAAFHDVLAALTWWIEARGVGLTFGGEPMPVDESGMGLHGDYVGRRDGWDWPGGDGGA